jgi:hypothetical protein
MKYRKYFKKIISDRFPDEGDSILRETDDRYSHLSVDTRFALTSSNPIDKRLDFTAYFLAFIHTLDSRGFGYEHIKAMCLEVTYEYVRPKNGIQRFLKKLPPKLVNTRLAGPLLKKFAEMVNKKGHPDGFRAKIITSRAETYGLGYGVDILECGICKLFKKHNSEKYSSILCEVDKYTSGMAGLTLIRNGTIANGAEKCDFRYKLNLKKSFS